MTTPNDTMDPELMAETMSTFFEIAEDAMRIFFTWRRGAAHDLSEDELIAGCFREAANNWLASQVEIF